MATSPEKKVEINEKTLVPLSLVVALVPTLWWIATLSARVEAGEDRQKMLGNSNAAQVEQLSQIREQLAEIKAELKHLNRRKP